MNHYINLRLPLELNPDFDQKRVAEIKVNQLVMLASTSFRHIKHQSFLFENGDLNRIAFLDIVNTLSELGEGVVNAIETVCREEVFMEEK